tara:strand:- start:312 stop:593 length:282 start_codon:yes stop_codon:yes gene_type:complete
MSKKNIKLDGYAWIAENGTIDYGFWFGDSDEPVSFATTLKEIVRQSLEAYRVPDGAIAQYHLEDMKRLSLSLQAAKNLIDHEIKRIDDVEEND